MESIPLSKITVTIERGDEKRVIELPVVMDFKTDAVGKLVEDDDFDWFGAYEHAPVVPPHHLPQEMKFTLKATLLRDGETGCFFVERTTRTATPLP